MKPRFQPVLLALGLAALALAPRTVHAQKRQRDVITRAELDSSAQRDLDLYTAVRSLRPHFLQPPPGGRTMGGSMPRETMLYVDGVRETGLPALKTLSASNVEEVRYLDPTQAESEFGPSASGGAVLVKLRKASKGTPRGFS